MKKAMLPFNLFNIDSMIWIDVLQINTVSYTKEATYITLIGDPDPYALKTSAEELIYTIHNYSTEV